MATYTVPGLSTLKMRLAYGADGATPTTGTGASVTELGRISTVGGVALSTEQIDVSAIDDDITKFVPGRQDTGGEWTVNVNVTDETLAEWDAIKGTTKWFEVYHPNITKAYWIRAAVPNKLPLGEVGQNEAFIMEVSLTLVDIGEWNTKVAIPA